MIAKTLLVIALLTSGWGPPPPPGPIVGKSYSLPYCVLSIGDPPRVLPEPACFDGEYLLFIGPVGFAVDVDEWSRYEMGDWYEE